jgi:phenylalanyl-tRNA synthetase beta subunit
MGSKKTPKGSDFLHELFAEFDVKVANLFPESSIVEIDLDTLLAAAPDPISYQTLPTLGDVRYKPFSRYPALLRDVAVWTPSGTEGSFVEEIIRTRAGETLVRLDLFDRFEKEGKISFAFHLVFQASDRTLSDEEVHPKMDAVYGALKDAGYEIR